MRRDVGGGVAVKRHHRNAELEIGRGVAEDLERLESERAGVVVRPHRPVAELCAALGQRCGDVRVEPGGDAESALAHAFSKSATASTWGVCGNMSTGFTRRSVYPASTICAALGASVVGLHET